MCRQDIRSSASAIIVVLFVLLAAPTVAEQHVWTMAPACHVAGSLVKVPELQEGSGVAASKRSPNRFWAHNDSGEPVLFALDSKGTVVDRVRVPGAKVDDWEAVAVGPCPAGSCIYIGDIGDNDAERRNVTIYRLQEPADTSGSAGSVDVFRARYPDGAHDAETLLVTPKGDILIVTKGDTGPVGLYRLPSDAKPGSTSTLQSIGRPRQPGKAPADERITDGAVSPGGEWVALRTSDAILLYRAEDLMSGNWKEASRLSLKGLDEPQGEGIAFGDESTIYLVGEGGKKSQPGTFGRLTCAS
jgi:hypothetical protein